MQSLQTRDIPEVVKKRMIQLCTLLASFSKEKITSQEIKALTGWTDSTIRHDFWLLDLKKGVSKNLWSYLKTATGYNKKSK